MKRIVVGQDGSPESKQALELALQLAEPMKAQLLIAFVAEAPLPLWPETDAQGLAQWELTEREYGHAILREAAARCAQSGVEAETLLESGPAAERLANLAKERDADLVVVGHRGRGAVARVLIGSVADRLTQMCPRPVLVAR